MLDARPKAVVTDSVRLNRISAHELPDMEHIIIAGDCREISAGHVSWDAEMTAASHSFEPVWLEPDAPFLIVYTSGHDGSPVGLVHVHEAMKGYLMTARWVLDIRDGDVVLTHGRPGWLLNIVYSAFAPWLCGVTTVVCDRIETAAELYDVIAVSRVSVLYTIPSVYALLPDAGRDMARRYDLSSLRHLLSVLEPLTPEMLYMVMAVLKLPVYDTWWTAETGMITIANMPCLPIKPGYLGKPCPGICAAVLNAHDEEAPFFEMGRLVLRQGWPAMARAIWGRDDFSAIYYSRAPWFTTGDEVFFDHDGYFFYQGRADDVVITSAGKVGMREIENCVQRHPAVAEAAVIRAAGPGGSKSITAFIVPASGYAPDADLERTIIGHVAGMLTPDIAPASIHWCAVLPRHADGRINTLVLKARALGLAS